MNQTSSANAALVNRETPSNWDLLNLTEPENLTDSKLATRANLTWINFAVVNIAPEKMQASANVASLNCASLENIVPLKRA